MIDRRVVVDETTTVDIVNRVAISITGAPIDASAIEQSWSSIPEPLQRTGELLPQAVFRSHHNEHAMLRYLRRLSDKDLALDRTMIPLGSCTMKLNATSEMIPVTWPEFGSIHPFAPLDQAQGYLEMIRAISAISTCSFCASSRTCSAMAGSEGRDGHC